MVNWEVGSGRGEGELTTRSYVDHRICRLAEVRFGNPSVALSLVAPRRVSSDSHRRSCLLAPSITGAYLEPDLATEAEAVCPSARWLHKSEPDILFGSTSFQFGGNHAQGGINRTI